MSSWTGAGRLHDPATWGGPFKIAESNDFALAGGPRGLWLAYADFNHGGNNPMIARKFGGKRFGKAHRIPVGRLGGGFVNGGLGIAQSPKGEMVAVWYRSPTDKLMYSASRTGRRGHRPACWRPASACRPTSRSRSAPTAAASPSGTRTAATTLNAVRVSVRSALSKKKR